METVVGQILMLRKETSILAEAALMRRSSTPTLCGVLPTLATRSIATIRLAQLCLTSLFPLTLVASVRNNLVLSL